MRRGVEMRSRRFAAMVTAVLIASTMLVSGTGPTRIQGASAASCASGQRQAYVTFKSTVNWTTYGEVYFGGGAPSIVNRHTIYSGPTGNVTFTFCVAKATTWSIKKAPDVVASGFWGINAQLEADGTGLMLRPGKVNATSVTLQPTICREDGRGTALVDLLSLPVPGVHYLLSLGVYLVGGTISSSTTCESFQTKTIPIYFESDGDTYANGFSAVYTEKFPETAGCTGSQCYFVKQYAWSVTTP
jgi:hypothetical protein